VAARLVARSGEPTALERWPATAAMLDYLPAAPILDQLAKWAITSDAVHVVVGTRQPDAGLFRALTETGSRFLVAVDHPRFAVADLVENTGAPPELAGRAVANSCALLMPYLSVPDTLVLHGDAARHDPKDTVRSIAGHFGLGVPDEAISEICIAVGSAGGADWVERIPAHASKAVGGALSGYEEYLRGVGFGRLVWNRELFLVAGEQRRAAEVLDLAGGTRTLIHGPYIQLPAGSWNARIHLGLSTETAGQPLLIEICGDDPLAAVTLQPNTPGIHIAELNFSYDGSAPRGLEVRLTVLSAEARGYFALGYVVLTPGGLHHPEAATDWEQQFHAAVGI
jgi:hypothetical protein